jgi:uncharacterized protein YdeI (BOF family)
MRTKIGNLQVQDDVIVRIQGRVVQVRDDEFLLRDRTGSVWVDTGRRPDVTIGERVTVVGEFDDDDFDPQQIIRRGGSNSNPLPGGNRPNRPGNAPRVDIGNLQVQDDVLVQIRGRVAQVRDDEFLLRDRTGSVWVDTERRPNVRVGERVTVVGEFDDDDFDPQRIIRQGGANNPSRSTGGPRSNRSGNAPRVDIGNLQVRDDVLVRIQGRVARVRDDEFLLRDRTGSVWVDTGRRPNVRVGERVAVVGEFDDDDFDPRRIIRRGGSNSNPPSGGNRPNRPGNAPRVDIGNLQVRDDVLVQIRGRVVQVRDDEFLLRDRTGSVWVDTRRRPNVRVGERVTVVGEFDDDDFDARRIIRQPRNRSMTRAIPEMPQESANRSTQILTAPLQDSLHGQFSDTMLVGDAGYDPLTGSMGDRAVMPSRSDLDLTAGMSNIEDSLIARPSSEFLLYGSDLRQISNLEGSQTPIGSDLRAFEGRELESDTLPGLTAMVGRDVPVVNSVQL